MKKVFEKIKGKLVRLDKNTVGVVCGYTSNHFIILLEEGIDADYAFSLDELGGEEHYIDMLFEKDCENCLYAYCDENQVK